MVTRILMTLALSVTTQVATAEESAADDAAVDEELGEGLDLFDAEADESTDEGDETTPLEERAYCSRYNQYGNNAYYYCTQDWQCRWNGRYCVNAQTATRCEYIRDYYQCRRSGCYWDNYYGCSSSGGGGGYRVWQCSASDTGWEEHFRGHTGRGYSQNEARRQALRNCQRPYGPHGQCYITECRRVQ
jgi:hypothetical protein